jgi:hypothetical protein
VRGEQGTKILLALESVVHRHASLANRGLVTYRRFAAGVSRARFRVVVQNDDEQEAAGGPDRASRAKLAKLNAAGLGWSRGT